MIAEIIFAIVYTIIGFAAIMCAALLLTLFEEIGKAVAKWLNHGLKARNNGKRNGK